MRKLYNYLQYLMVCCCLLGLTSMGYSQNPITLEILLDNFPGETSWEIIDNSNNATVASGGTYGNLAAGSLVTENIDLPNGDYTFTIFDALDDGICCSFGMGDYTLTDDTSNVTLASGANFGSSESTMFTFSSSIFCTDCDGNDPECTDPTTTANPALMAMCGSMNVAIVLDESGSVFGNAADVATGTNAFVNGLNCTGASVAIIEFNPLARTVTDYTEVDDAFVTSVEGYFTGTPLNGETYAPVNNQGTTNWQDAMQKVDDLATTPDLILFFTDGIPTSWTSSPGVADNCGNGGTTEAPEIVNPVLIANKLKAEGAHMFMLGVAGATATTLQQMSGTTQYTLNPDDGFDITNSDFAIENFDELAECLSAFASEICPFDSSIDDACSADGVTITAMGDFSYEIFDSNGDSVTTGMGMNSVTETGIAAGDYSAEVSFMETGCTRIETVFFEVFDSPMVTGVVTGETCGDDNDGSIDITVTGGTLDYSFAWSSNTDPSFSESTEDLSGLADATYTVVVTDDNGCTATEDFVVEPGVESVITCVEDIDIDLDSCAEIPAAFTDPSDVFEYIEACAEMPVTMTVTDDPDMEVCDGVDFTRTYTLFFDGVEQSPTCTQLVTIAAAPAVVLPTDVLPASVTCTDDLVLEEIEIDNGGSDGCLITAILTPTTPDSVCVDTITVTWTGTDSCGEEITYEEDVIISGPEAGELVYNDEAAFCFGDSNADNVVVNLGVGDGGAVPTIDGCFSHIIFIADGDGFIQFVNETTATGNQIFDLTTLQAGAYRFFALAIDTDDISSLPGGSIAGLEGETLAALNTALMGTCSELEQDDDDFTINALPEIEIEADAEVCQCDDDQTITFTATAGNPAIDINYTVAVDGGTPTPAMITIPVGATTATVTQNVSTPGTYVYSLVDATDSFGCSQELTGTATIQVDPTELVFNEELPQAITQSCELEIPAPAVLTATDECNGDIYDEDDVVFTETTVPDADCANASVITRTWTVEDCEAQNMISHTQIITIIDTTAPVADQTEGAEDIDVTLECSDEQGLVDALGFVPTFTDNCSGDPLDTSNEGGVVTVTMTSDVTTPDPECANAFVQVRTWTADDGCDNVTTFTQTITVQDTTAPIIGGPVSNSDDILTSDGFSCPEDVVFNVVVGQTLTFGESIMVDGINLDNPFFSVSDNCTANEDLVASVNSIVEIGDSCSKTTTITLTIADGCGNNSVDITFIYNLIDDTPPVVNQAAESADVELECSDTQGIADALAFAPTFTDNCQASEDIVVTLVSDDTVADDDCANAFVQTRVWTATDSCGENVSEPFMQTITVIDTTAPVADQTEGAEDIDVTLECSDEQGLVDALGFVPTFTDNCSGDPIDTSNEGGVVTVTMTSDVTTPDPDCANAFVRVRMWTADDGCDNVSEPFTQTITVIDTTAPVADQAEGAEDIDVTLECDDAEGLEEALEFEPTFTDNCGENVTVSMISDETTPDPECANAFVRVRMWTADDGCDNVSEPFTQTITVVDTTAPVVVDADGSETVECITQAVEPELPEVMDCTAMENLIVAFTTTDNTDGCTGEFIYEYTFSDGCGNTSDVWTFTYTIRGPEAGLVSLNDPGSVCLGTESLGNVEVGLTIDTDGNFPTFDGECFDHAIFVVNALTAEVVLVDETVAIGSRILDFSGFDAGQYFLGTLAISVDDLTALPGGGTLQGLVGQSLGNLNNALADTCHEIEIIDDDFTIDPLPEISIEADAEVCQCSEAPAITFTALEGRAPWTVTYTFDDGSGPVEQTIVIEQGETTAEVIQSVALPGTFTYTLVSVVDFNGCENTLEGSAVITVDPTELVFNEELPEETITVECSEIPEAVILTAMDTCTGDSFDVVFEETTTLVEGACPDDYTITRTWTVSDCGVGELQNSIMHTQVITVEDTIAPMATCPGPSEIDQLMLEEDCLAVIPDYTDLVSVTDNCDMGEIEIVQSPAAGTTLAAGATQTITMTVMDCAGNESSCEFEVTVEGALEITETADMTFCNEEEAIAIPFTTTNPSTITWTSSADVGFGTAGEGDIPSYTATNMSADAITAVVTVSADNGIGCMVESTFSVTVNPDILLETEFTMPLCFGDTNGTATVNVTQGVGEFTYEWTTFTGSSEPEIVGTSPTIEDLAAGLYIVQVTGDNGCTALAEVEITQPDELLIDFDNIAITDVACFGEATGAATVAATGGTLEYTYEWTVEGQTDVIGTEATITGLEAGSYVATVTDANGCMNSNIFEIGQPDAPLAIGEPVIANVTCNDDDGTSDDGSIDITVSGGTQDALGTYSFSWSNGATTEDISGLAAGDYTVTVTDANNCTLEMTYTVTQPEQLLIAAEPMITMPLCNGDANGSIDIEVSGGTMDYTYEWIDVNDPSASSPISEEQDLIEITAGEYMVTVTDANGCTTTATYTVGEPDVLVINPDPAITEVTCTGFNDGAIDVTIMGGTPEYMFAWEGPNGFMADTEDIQGLFAGTYTLVVTDMNGCVSEELEVVIEQPDLLDFQTNANTVTCDSPLGFVVVFEGNAGLPGTGGGTPPYTFDWQEVVNVNGNVTNVDIGDNDDPAFFEDLPAGDYRVIVTDDNGCTLVRTATINPEAGYNPAQANFSSEPIDGGVQFTNLSQFGVEFEWDFGDGTTSSEENPFHIYDEPGEFEVCLTAIDECGGFDITCMNTVGIESPDMNIAFSVLPVTGIQGPRDMRTVITIQNTGEVETDPTEDITFTVTTNSFYNFEWEPNATEVGLEPNLENSLWIFDDSLSGAGLLIWTRAKDVDGNTIPIGSNEQSTIAYLGVWDAGASGGQSTFTATLINGSGGEVNSSNNSDTGTVNYIPAE